MIVSLTVFTYFPFLSLPMFCPLFYFAPHPTPPFSDLFTSKGSKTKNAVQQGACALKAPPFDSWPEQLMGHVTSQLAE